jgi:hypothetical protein
MAAGPSQRREQHQQSATDLLSAVNVSDVIRTMATTPVSTTTPPEIIDNLERVRAYEIAA